METSWALDVHEERVWLGDNLLELVGSGVNVRRSVEEIDSESLGVSCVLFSQSISGLDVLLPPLTDDLLGGASRRCDGIAKAEHYRACRV